LDRKRWPPTKKVFSTSKVVGKKKRVKHTINKKRKVERNQVRGGAAQRIRKNLNRGNKIVKRAKRSGRQC